MDTLIALLTEEEFRQGVLLGLAGSLVLGVLMVTPLSRRLDTGVVLAGAAVIGIAEFVGRRGALTAGIVVLALAGWVWDRAPWMAMMAAPAGAVLVMFGGGLGGPVWMRLGGVVAILVIALGIAVYDDATDNPPAIGLLGVSIFGIWADVPETDLARFLLGAWVGVVPGALISRVPSVGRAGGAAVAGLMVWTSTQGGLLRPGSVVGAWATAGVFAIAPLFSRIPQRPWGVALLHIGMVYVASRVAGFRTDPVSAALIAAFALMAGAVVMGWLVHRDGSVALSRP